MIFPNYQKKSFPNIYYIPTKFINSKSTAGHLISPPSQPPTFHYPSLLCPNYSMLFLYFIPTITLLGLLQTRPPSCLTPFIVRPLSHSSLPKAPLSQTSPQTPRSSLPLTSLQSTNCFPPHRSSFFTLYHTRIYPKTVGIHLSSIH